MLHQTGSRQVFPDEPSPVKARSEEELEVQGQICGVVENEEEEQDIIELPRDDHLRMKHNVRPALSSDEDEDEDEEQGGGRGFHAVKPWVGSLQPPSDFDPSTVNYRAPDYTLELDYVYGYRTRGARDNVFWVDEPNLILYHSAAVCVVGDITTRSQRYFTGHEDDVLCLTYNKHKRLAASGGLGKRNTAPLFIWSVDTMEEIQLIKGQLEFGVISCDFSKDATRIMAIGMDTYHTVAIFDVGTGLCLCSARGDSNKIIHGVTDTRAGEDSKRSLITIGVSHIKFWSKPKGKDQLVGSKAIGQNISSTAMCSVCCTPEYVCVGNVLGEIYIFSGKSVVKHINAHISHCGALCFIEDQGKLLSGGRDGKIKTWTLPSVENMGKVKGKLEADPRVIDLNDSSALSTSSRYVKSEKSRPHNQPKALVVGPSGNNIITGTNLGGIYAINMAAYPSDSAITTVLECHYDAAPGTMSEIWGMDVHPNESLFATVADDATLRLWSLDLGTLILMTPVTYPARALSFSPDGQMIAIGHSNGAFSVWDAMTLTPIVPFTRKRTHRVQDLRFSPDGKFLAMSMGQSNIVDVYYVHNNFEFVGFCDGFSTNIKRLDWNSTGDVLQCCTGSYELVHFNMPQCEVNQSPELTDERWHTHSSFIGWGVQGIWEGCNDGTDINCCGLSPDRKLLVCGYDSCRVRLYNYPCLPKTVESSGQLVYPGHREFIGHSSHVTQAYFSHNGQYVITAGGMDSTIIRWKIVMANRPSTFDPADPNGVNQENQGGEKSKEDVAADVERGKIRELGETLKNKLPNELNSTYGHGGKYERLNSGQGNRSQGGLADDEETFDDPTVQQRPTSPPRRTTARRPGTASAHRTASSRLMNTTASMSTKTAHGRAQRAHILQQQQAQKRFSGF